MTLAGKTLFISGGSRGIGLAIALRAARDGANVAPIAKTAEPHPALEGTVYTATAQIEAAGGRALPVGYTIAKYGMTLCALGWRGPAGPSCTPTRRTR